MKTSFAAPWNKLANVPVSSALRPGNAIIRTLALAGLLALASPPASAGPGGLGTATEWTQRLNNVELGTIAGLEARILSTGTEQLLTEVEQLATQIRTYEIMLRNVRNLPEQHLRAAMAPILRLREIGAEAGAIAQAGHALDSFLRSDLITDPLFDRTGLERANVAARYDDWQARWQASLKAGLGTAGATLTDVENEAELIDLVTARFGSEAGQMQVLQGANQIAASLARQMNGLRAITATQAEQTSLAWGRVLADMDREEALRRRHEREVHETLESLERVAPGPSLNEIFRIGE
ncbi:hypothetical protein [Ruegeria atlantica]|uniref:hypothetical protein n=1 Tax=Ruegeria atlantica TaxID=81569 RepID=UPI00147CACFC|nr:hypothetical protein [Ruegeria atlantica]